MRDGLAQAAPTQESFLLEMRATLHPPRSHVCLLTALFLFSIAYVCGVSDDAVTDVFMSPGAPMVPPVPALAEYKEALLRDLSVGSASSPPESSPAPELAPSAGVVTEQDIESEGETTRARRTNFAAQEAGATVMGGSPEWTGISALLAADADSYALARCDVKKFVILGLSEDVLVDELVIANEEKYSSSVATMRVLGSQKYPATEWIVLGNFTAANALGDQTFAVNVRTWVRYMKISWLSHYGNEFYCTWTRVKVHGSTMLEELQHQMLSSDAEVSAARAQIEARGSIGDEGSALVDHAPPAAQMPNATLPTSSDQTDGQPVTGTIEGGVLGTTPGGGGVGGGSGDATNLAPTSCAAPVELAVAALENASDVSAAIVSSLFPFNVSELDNATEALDFLNVTADDLDTPEERRVELEALQCLATAWEEKSIDGGDAGADRVECSVAASSAPVTSSSTARSAEVNGTTAADSVSLAGDGGASSPPNGIAATAVPATHADDGGASSPPNDIAAAAVPATHADDFAFASLGTIGSRRAASGSAASGAAGVGTAATANVFKTLTSKLKDLEIDSSVTQSYLSDMHTQYGAAITSVTRDVADLRAGLEEVVTNASRAILSSMTDDIAALRVDLDDLLTKLSLRSNDGAELTALHGGLRLPARMLDSDVAAAAAVALLAAQPLLSGLNSSMSDLLSALHRVEVKQTALTLSLLRVLHDGGDVSAVIAPSGIILRREDATPSRSSSSFGSSPSPAPGVGNEHGNTVHPIRLLRAAGRWLRRKSRALMTSSTQQLTDARDAFRDIAENATDTHSALDASFRSMTAQLAALHDDVEVALVCATAACALTCVFLAVRLITRAVRCLLRCVSCVWGRKSRPSTSIAKIPLISSTSPSPPAPALAIEEPNPALAANGASS